MLPGRELSSPFKGERLSCSNRFCLPVSPLVSGELQVEYSATAVSIGTNRFTYSLTGSEMKELYKLNLVIGRRNKNGLRLSDDGHPQRRRMRKKMIRMASRKPRLPGQINQRPLPDRPTTKQPERPTVVPLPIRTMNNRLSLLIEMLLVSFTAESPLDRCCKRFVTLLLH